MTSRDRHFYLVVGISPAILILCLLMGPAGIGLPDWTTQHEILLLRVTRILAGLIVGAALSTAGVVLQAILRNPLAEPYVLGVSSGAGLGAALAILTGFSALGPFTLPFTAFLLAVATLIAVYALASNSGATPSLYGLILSGVSLSAKRVNS